jgi:hypothetical protein
LAAVCRVGTLLRQAADALGRAACLPLRVKVGGGQRRMLLSGHSTDGAGKKLGGAAALASLALLGLCWWAMAGRWG